ncbi:MAG: FHA domain-containing protein [Gemmataceae bacterium]
MPAQLVALSEGPSILLDKPIMLFGRHPECDIQIESRKVSRRHCCIAQVKDYLVVRDLGSTNGIRINGVRLDEGQLHEGDELTIGSHLYRVTWNAWASSSKDQSGPPPKLAPPALYDDDDLLEECDDPVPLDEPVDVPPAAAVPNPLATVRDAAELSPPAAEPPPPVLPEHLTLAPSSDIVRPAPSSSHQRRSSS